MNRESRRAIRKQLRKNKKGHYVTSPGVQLNSQKYVDRYKQRVIALEDEALQYATLCDQLADQVGELTKQNQALADKLAQYEPAEEVIDPEVVEEEPKVAQ